MNCIKKISFYIFIICSISIANAQSISVNDSYTAQQLVENILVNSSCANSSNPIATGDTFNPGKNSYAYFNSGASSFPFTEGVLLSTWSSTNSIGPFVRNQGGGDPSWPGDKDLEQVLGIAKTVNATVLEFDFTPLTNYIGFNYLFASNEYQDNFPCRFSDGFAFLIKEKGSAANYQNLAVIPNTTTPVSSINIHPLISLVGKDGCPPKNEDYFGGYSSASSPTNYSAQTVVMTAQTAVIVGTTYHIKLIIADDNNPYFDSAVYLQAGSFSPKIDLGADRSLTTNNPICFGESYTIDTKLPSTYAYKWFKDGVELLSETSPSYQVTDTGNYKVEVTLTPTVCTATDEIKVEYAPKVDLKNTMLSQCDDDTDGITLYDLTKADNLVKNNDISLSTVVYYESLIDAQGQNNPIVNPSTYNSKISNQIVFARATNSFGCVNYAEVNLLISNNSISPQNPISTCDADFIQDGLYHFDLVAQVTPRVLSGLPSGLQVEYYLNSNDAISQKNPLPNIFSNTIPNQQIIYARIINGPDCYAITPETLIVNTFNPPNFQEETTSLCTDVSINLFIDAGFSSYQWNTGETTSMITVSSPGNYSVKVTNLNGCAATKKFNVLESGIAIINDFAGNGNSVLLEYSGVGNYEFSLDGTFFQDNPLFNGVAAGEYLAYARDKNGCGLSNPFQIYVLDYPRYFTPNGDGYNDSWEIKNLDLLPKSTITIFDRYGKLLLQSSSLNAGWNGTFNGYSLPADDYWFSLNFEDNKIIKGHFSLKR